MLNTALWSKRQVTKVALAIGFVFGTTGFTTNSKLSSQDLEVWILGEQSIAQSKMFANFSPSGSAIGTIIASPSTQDPNYYYYWVRDGALVMQSVFDLSNSTLAGAKAAKQEIETFARFSRQNQKAAASNLGEPRFNIDGSVNTEPWGRPQNDGPALRALLFIRYANALLNEGKRDKVLREFYAPVLPAESLIKTDLEFTAHHWQDRCVDLWEEVWGHHFFTRAAQFMALKEGADLADKLGDGGAAAFYREQSRAIEAELAHHWSDEKGYYISTLQFSASEDHQKASQLDVSVILAALAAEQTSGFLSLTDDRMLKTAMAIESAFISIYGLNRDQSTGTAIGRYPEDHYFGGNPWVLATAAYAEMNFKIAAQVAGAKSFVLTETQARFLSQASAISQKTVGALHAGTDLASDRGLKAEVVAALQANGDRYLERIRRHANADGSLSEQYGRDHGKMISARDLTWSYASFLRALTARTNAKASTAAH